jgi:hypothetical protein
MSLELAIDFSITSPGVCFSDGNSYTFMSFYRKSSSKKMLELFEELSSVRNVLYRLSDSHRTNGEKYNRREQNALYDMAQYTGEFSSFMFSSLPSLPSRVAIEGLSFGSKSSSLADVSSYHSFIRFAFAQKIGYENVFVFAPTTVKKTAGKGNFKKHDMIKAFMENTLNDPLLENDPLRAFIIKNEKDLWDSKGLSMQDPIADLVDAYFCLKTLQLSAL